MNEAELCKIVLKYVREALRKLETFGDKLHLGKATLESEKSWSAAIIHQRIHAFKLFKLHSFH